MSDEAAAANPAAKSYRITATGLQVTDGMTFAKWAELGAYLGQMNRASPWLVGDWLNWGEKAYGETYSQALEETGLELSTLRNYKYVAGKIPPDRRRAKLRFGHHAEVAALEPADQDKWLDQAEEGGWTVQEMRYRMAGGTIDDAHGEPSLATAEPVASPGRKSLMEQLKALWLKAPAAVRQDFRIWIDIGDMAPPGADAAA